MPHSLAGVRLVRKARNHVQVDVEDGLPGRRSVVPADRVSVRIVLGVEVCLGPLQKRIGRPPLSFRQVEDGLPMLSRSDDAGPDQHRVRLLNVAAAVVLKDDGLLHRRRFRIRRGAERTHGLAGTLALYERLFEDEQLFESEQFSEGERFSEDDVVTGFHT